MIGGSCYVMVYLAVAILIFFRRPLLSMKSSEDMVNYLKHVRKVVFDWFGFCCCLLVSVWLVFVLICVIVYLLVCTINIR